MYKWLQLCPLAHFAPSGPVQVWFTSWSQDNSVSKDFFAATEAHYISLSYQMFGPTPECDRCVLTCDRCVLTCLQIHTEDKNTASIHQTIRPQGFGGLVLLPSEHWGALVEARKRLHCRNWTEHVVCFGFWSLQYSTHSNPALYLSTFQHKPDLKHLRDVDIVPHLQNDSHA